MTPTIDLGGESVAATDVVRYVRRDLMDDWYSDSLGYEDMLTPERIAEAVEKVIGENSGSFVPGPNAVLDIPKRGFVLRYSVETSLIDRAHYHALAQFLAPYYAPPA